MKRILLLGVLLAGLGIQAKDGSHPEFDLLDKDGVPIVESGNAMSKSITCGDCHESSENVDVYADLILQMNLHPRVPLKDEYGELVIQSGEPLSTENTCGSCHDVRYITSHSDHANAGVGNYVVDKLHHDWSAGAGYFGAWNIYDYDLIEADEDGPDVDSWLTRYGSRHVGGGPVSESLEMNCFLCHTDVLVNQERIRLLQEEEFEWANSAPLISTGILINEDDDWTWNKEAFNPDGSVAENKLPILKPTDENCGQCHGLVYNDLDNPLLLPDDVENMRRSVLTGQIFSPQKLNLTGLNIVGKKELNRPFDVHADRVVGCVNCHYSLNNPIYYQRYDEEQPDHLAFDPRRLSYSEYLKNPLHQFAKGSSKNGLASQTQDSMRRCESCHSEEAVHDWLPYKERHFSALACESCHIPELYSPTIMTIDWTLPDSAGRPTKTYRNSDVDYANSENSITSYEPILLPRSNSTGEKKLAPFNVLTGWYWLAGDEDERMPIARETLVEAFSDGDLYNDDILAAFDTDQDGSISINERRLDSAAKVTLLKQKLAEVGLENPELSGEMTYFPINHNVVSGQWATKDCQACHQEDSRIDDSMILAMYSPHGMTPDKITSIDTKVHGSLEILDDGSLAYKADASTSGYYILGLDNIPLIDIIGLLMFFGVILAVNVHAVARKVASSRRAPNARRYRKEYIYDAYERLWHWLQAGSIIILLFTGLIIHKPHMFSMFSFAYMVEIHNIVGFILFANAALSLFYNLASGEIKQFIPEPKGFIGRSIAQASYYTKGVFEGQSHPEEKSRDRKMNVLQQVTYLAILYILLPAQVITGILIWGAQEWPEIASSVGGLAFLGPVHTFIAWTFATFIVMHVYLTTHGHTPTAGIKAMIRGWDEVEDNPKQSQ